MGNRELHLKGGERLEVVRSLFLLGFTTGDVACTLSLNRATIRNDLRALGGAKRFVTRYLRPSDKRATFQRTIKLYAQLVSGKCGKEYVVHKELRFTLARWIGEEQILDFLNGVAVAMDILLALGYPSGKEGYARLLSAVFGVNWIVSATHFTSDGRRELWDEYLGEVAEDRIIALPASRVELKHVLAMRCVATCRAQIRPVLSDAVFAKIDEQLATLTAREQPVLQARCGIGMAQQKADEVAQELGVTGKRFRQIESKALRKLKSSSRGLKCLVDPVSIAVEKCMELERSNEQLLHELNAMKAEKLAMALRL